MIGLTVLILAVAWLFIVAKITSAVSQQSAPTSYRFVFRAIMFPVLLLIPFADEIVGSWQFQHLCAGEAKVWIAPNARDVIAAKSASEIKDRPGFVIPISEQSEKYVDLATGQTFYSFKAFHTKGGIVMRMGLGLGNSRSCWPDKWTAKENNLDIDAMLKQGEKH